MGARFRKSKNFGPFRVNISKSGIGYSVGNKFVRVAHTADGKKRTTYTLPGTGLSWTETESKGEQQNRNSPQIENWQRQAIENGWTPPENQDDPKDPAGIGGYWKFVLLILAVIVLSTWWNNRKTEQPKSTIPTKEPTAQTDTTKPYVLPGSAKEAVMNGELEMADIQHRADVIGWSTDAWQEWYYIASQTGTTMEAIEEAAKNINEKLAAEDAEFLLALDELGISKDDAKAMKPEELFEKVIYGLQAMDN